MMMDIEITSQAFTRGQLKKIKQDLRSGKIRRFAAIVNHQKLGFNHNAMIAWQKPAVNSLLSHKLKEKNYISHIYLRKATPLWPFGLYTMLHAQSRKELDLFVRELSELMPGCAYKVLDTVKEFKKTSFHPD